MKNILLLTDFSEASINAIEYAGQLFKGQETTFFVLNTFVPIVRYHAVTLDDIEGDHKDVGVAFEEHATQKVQKIIDKVVHKLQDQKHVFVAVSSFNTLVAGIHELLDAHEMDCIIMGTTGATGLKEVFIGSQTMHVIKEATIPVIGVPAGYEYKRPTDIVFVTDYKTGETQLGLSLLDDICTQHTSRLIFLNAYQGTPLNVEQLKHENELDTYFKHHALITQTSGPMEVPEAIANFHATHRIDLLVLVHNKHNFFENLLFAPVVQKVVYHATMPFLILPPSIQKN